MNNDTFLDFLVFEIARREGEREREVHSMSSNSIHSNPNQSVKKAIANQTHAYFTLSSELRKI